MTRPEPEPALRSGPLNSTRVLVALPVYNEARYLDDVLLAVRQHATDILVVNDGSTDDTGAALVRHPYVRLITHERNMGYGRSLTDAMTYAWTHRFEWLITMDCDHQHEPSCIPHFYDEIAKNEVDIVSGSRYLRLLDIGPLRPPPERVALNQEITALLNRILGIGLTDAFCGFKAYRTAAICRLGLTEAGYGMPLQLWVRAQRQGLAIREIPVPLIYYDPKRAFCRELEDPQKRRAYYLRVLSQELGRDVIEAAEKPGCPSREGHRLYSS
jgi:glycosyltransferase involved in cell wall biosynthesis